MDDIVVKSKDKATLIQDLDETFANLRKISLKLNPEKCVFGVPSGKLLGFFVSQRGIEANHDKIKAIEQIEAPKRVKDVRRLAGCVAALSRFISRSAERPAIFQNSRSNEMDSGSGGCAARLEEIPVLRSNTCRT